MTKTLFIIYAYIGLYIYVYILKQHQQKSMEGVYIKYKIVDIHFV